MRAWLFAAALYNAVWGSGMVASPEALLGLFGIPAPAEPLPWRVVGMMVLVYAPGYWWSARHPALARPLVAIAVLGKTLGIAGFVVGATQGAIPWAYGPMILTNDVVWMPAFLTFLLAPERQHPSPHRRLRQP